MKFVDPIASLQYMGGALTIHLSMAMYAYKIYYDIQSQDKMG